VDDFIFGSHRSHGEILAKCYSAVWQLDEKKLEAIMKNFLGGETLAIAEKIAYENVKDLAENFVLYGTLAEIFARKAGINRGLGGSMHAYFTPFGSMPNNAIVGGSADIATGAALFKRINETGHRHRQHRRRVHGAPRSGGHDEGRHDQYRTLWPRTWAARPPSSSTSQQLQRQGGQPTARPGYQVSPGGAGVNPETHSDAWTATNPLRWPRRLRKRPCWKPGRVRSSWTR
jgi:2-oxoisovalerate dehydrogenase E1 component